MLNPLRRNAFQALPLARFLSLITIAHVFADGLPLLGRIELCKSSFPFTPSMVSETSNVPSAISNSSSFLQTATVLKALRLRGPLVWSPLSNYQVRRKWDFRFLQRTKIEPHCAVDCLTFHSAEVFESVTNIAGVAAVMLMSFTPRAYARVISFRNSGFQNSLCCKRRLVPLNYPSRFHSCLYEIQRFKGRKKLTAGGPASSLDPHLI